MTRDAYSTLGDVTDAFGRLTDTAFSAYPVDEFCYILAGQVTITDGDGHAETFVAGDCFVIPRGLRCTWHMPETTRKYYVILDSGTV